MKLAIVGSSNLDPSLVIAMRDKIESTLANFPNDTIIISGGANGVDTIAIDVAKHMGFEYKIFKPEIEQWLNGVTKTGRRTRNLKIAEECDKLYCFTIPYYKTKCYHHDTPQDHEKTAGCWTLMKAKQLQKPTELFILPFNAEMLKINERIIEYSSDQTDTILTLVVNLQWDLVRDMLNFYTDKSVDSNSDEDKAKRKRTQQLIDDLQELESIVKGVPIA